MKIEFVNISEENRSIALSLDVSSEQKSFIESVSDCLKEAESNSLWHPILIKLDDFYVGFAMYGLFKEEGEGGRAWLDRFLIDEKHQGHGYSKLILPELMSKIKKEFSCNEIYLSIYEKNSVALRLYQRFGFDFNGELDINGEKVMIAKV